MKPATEQTGSYLRSTIGSHSKPHSHQLIGCLTPKKGRILKVSVKTQALLRPLQVTTHFSKLSRSRKMIQAALTFMGAFDDLIVVGFNETVRRLGVFRPATSGHFPGV